MLFPVEGVPLIALKQHTAFVFISLAYSRLHTYRRSFAETSPRCPSVADSVSSVKRLVFTCSPQTNLVSPAGNTSITLNLPSVRVPPLVPMQTSKAERTVFSFLQSRLGGVFWDADFRVPDFNMVVNHRAKIDFPCDRADNCSCPRRHKLNFVGTACNIVFFSPYLSTLPAQRFPLLRAPIQ